MSILIKGMEMHRSRPVCIVIDAAGQARRYDLNNDRYADDKLFETISVPPHGRCIDADKQDAQIEALIERHLHGYTKSTWDFVCELRDILKRNRTIIPAEDEHTMEEFMYGQEGNPNDGSM